MWLSSGAVSDRWALAHEFMHGLQIRAGGMAGGNTNQGTNFRGWFFESHANLTPHQVYPNDVHYCGEMYTRMAHLYYGSTRNRYCNWHFFEYINHRFGPKAVNDLWTSAQSGANHDPFTELMHRNSLNQRQFGDVFGDFAKKAVIWDINRHGQNNTASVFPDPAYAARGSARFRDFFNRNLGNPDEMFKRPRYTYLEALDGNNATNNRYVVPSATAPQRYGYNIIRLYPANGGNWNGGNVTVRFRGDVQTANNITNYTKNLNLEPAATHLPNNPGSDWRYGLVAVTGDANARTGTVSARYSPLMRASDCSPDVSITMQGGETQLYLVVAATPTIHHRITWDQFYYTIYRFPYMVEINGARPEGFQSVSNPAGGPHANGGGFVANAANVSATAFVGPNARVLGGTVRDNARIEGRAVVRGGTIRDNAIVRDHALVVNGTISDRAVIANGANIYNAQVSGDARIEGAPSISNANARISGNAVVGGVGWIRDPLNLSGTAQILGDGEIYNVTATSGIYYGLVDAGVINNNQFGGNRTSRPTEVTKPRSTTWNEVLAGCSSTPSSSSVTPSSSSATPSSSSVAPSSSSATPSSSSVTPSSSSSGGVSSSSAVQSSSSVTPSSSSSGGVSSSSVVQSSSSTDITSVYNVAVPGVRAFDMNNRGMLYYNLGDINSAKLKIYDSRGNLLKTKQLSGTAGTIDIGINTPQVLLWRVETNDGKTIQQTKINTIVR
jgi:carbonic anhydrase/acetyltransferase-like protein (isoleucine patch superfamily)